MLCLTVDTLLMALAFPYYVEVKNHDPNEIRCESGCMPIWKSKTALAILSVSALFCLGFFFWAVRTIRRQLSSDGRFQRRLFYVAISTYVTVPGFMLSMRWFYPYIENCAASWGFELTNHHYHVARAAFPIYVALAAWVTWWFTAFVTDSSRATEEAQVDQEKMAVKENVDDA